jgi:hypothetical protein
MSLFLGLSASRAARIPVASSTMPQAVHNLRAHLQLTDAQIRQLTWNNPRRAIGEPD